MGQIEQGKSLVERKPLNWILIFILFLAILGAYYESLSCPFLNVDDPFYIRDNPYIRDLSWNGIYKIFSQPMVANYFPLQILTYALDYQIWHMQPFGYHLHNVMLHFLNAVLVFFLLKKVFVQSLGFFFCSSIVRPSSCECRIGYLGGGEKECPFLGPRAFLFFGLSALCRRAKTDSEERILLDGLLSIPSCDAG